MLCTMLLDIIYGVHVCVRQCLFLYIYIGVSSWSLPCKLSVKGQEYNGNVSITKEGIECQRWLSYFPHSHDNDDSSKFPDSSIW